MNRNLSEEEAIRVILSEGGGGDFADIAERVRQRFGKIVGSALVEKIHREMSPESTAAAAPDSRLKHADISLTDLRHSTPSPATPHQSPSDSQHAAGAEHAAETPQEKDVLQFVQRMGGFEQARRAIDELEASVRRLLK